MYRTIDRHNNILETWDTREQVSPTLDYHKIQHIKIEGLDKRQVVHSEYFSMYALNNIPF